MNRPGGSARFSIFYQHPKSARPFMRGGAPLGLGSRNRITSRGLALGHDSETLLGCCHLSGPRGTPGSKPWSCDQQSFIVNITSVVKRLVCPSGSSALANPPGHGWNPAPRFQILISEPGRTGGCTWAFLVAIIPIKGAEIGKRGAEICRWPLSTTSSYTCPMSLWPCGPCHARFTRHHL